MRDGLKVATASLAVLTCCYVAIYLATVEAVPPLMIKGPQPPNVAVYSVDAQAVEVFFYPANGVDRRVRPRLWNE
jgi:hypothetical protein